MFLVLCTTPSRRCFNGLTVDQADNEDLINITSGDLNCVGRLALMSESWSTISKLVKREQNTAWRKLGEGGLRVNSPPQKTFHRSRSGKQAITMNSTFVSSLVVITGVLIVQGTNLLQSLWGLSEAQEIAFCILVIAAVLWISELIPLFVTSFVILGLQLSWLLPTINSSSEVIRRQAFLSPFFSDIILLFLGGFVLSAILRKYDLDQRIAKWILGRTGDKPAHLLLAVILLSAFLSMWMSNTATAAMMFSIALPIIYKVPATSNFSRALALSIPFSCNLGGLGTPIGTPPNAIAISYLSKNGVAFSFAGWMQMCVPIVILLLFLLWWLLLKLYPPRDLRLNTESGTTSERLSSAQVFVILIFLVTCAGWLTTDLHGFSTGMVALFPIVACFGSKLLGNEDFRNLSWDVLFMLGGGLCLGVGLQASGLTNEMLGLVAEDANYLVVLVSVALVGLIMSTFISNTATANLLIPLVVSFNTEIGLFAVTVALACSSAMALPVSTPPNAIAFGSGVLRSKDILIAGSFVSFFAFAMIIIMGKYYWPWVGGI